MRVADEAMLRAKHAVGMPSRAINDWKSCDNVLEFSCWMNRTTRPGKSVPMWTAAKFRVTLLQRVLLKRNSFVAETHF